MLHGSSRAVVAPGVSAWPGQLRRLALLKQAQTKARTNSDLLIELRDDLQRHGGIATLADRIIPFLFKYLWPLMSATNLKHLPLHSQPKFMEKMSRSMDSLERFRRAARRVIEMKGKQRKRARAGIKTPFFKLVESIISFNKASFWQQSGKIDVSKVSLFTVGHFAHADEQTLTRGAS